tara:strand:+ start:3901 stop:4464 length:564 start_codon:yes stop_codon:yes gene_type:complete
MQIHQAIFHIKKVIPLADCKKMISYMDKHCKTKAEVMSKHGKPITETKTRNVLSHWLNPNDYGAPPYFKIVENAVKEGMMKFSKHIKFLGRLHLHEVNLLKYEKGHFYIKHVDHAAVLNRTISIIINLNEKYQGGDVVFFNPFNDQPYSKPDLKAGDMILFPSNFLYPHQVTTITKGCRYSIVTWLT